MFAKKTEAAESIESAGDPAPVAADPAPPIDAPASEPSTGAPDEASTGRFEEYDAVKPDGTAVHIRRNIDTGEQTVTEK